MSEAEHRESPYQSNQSQLLKLFETALGRPLTDHEDVRSPEYRAAQDALEMRLHEAALTFERLQSGEDVSESEIDYEAVAIVHNLLSQIAISRDN